MKIVLCVVLLIISNALFPANNKLQDDKSTLSIPWEIANLVEHGRGDDEDIQQVKKFLDTHSHNIYATDLYGESLIEIASKNKHSQTILKLCQQRLKTAQQQRMGSIHSLGLGADKLNT